jgi:hypothetical protein
MFHVAHVQIERSISIVQVRAWRSSLGVSNVKIFVNGVGRAFMLQFLILRVSLECLHQ